MKFLHFEYLKGGLASFSNNFKGSVSYGILAPGYRIAVVNPYYGDITRTQYWSESEYWKIGICDSNKQFCRQIDTKGQNAEFSNDISQETWKKEWHNEKANNYPTEMKDVKQMGLVKDGEGELTLSGKNSTYSGDTKVKKGTLKLSGKLAKSNVFAENGGTFLFYNGEVVKEATAQNGGFINIESNNNKVGRLISQNGGTIWLKNNGSIEITNGASIENNGTLQGTGTINGSVVNSGLLKAGFSNTSDSCLNSRYSLPHLLKAGFSNTSDSIDSSLKLTISDKYTQEDSGELQFLFTKTANSQLNAQSYTINGGKLVYVPIQNADTLIVDGDKIVISMEQGLKDKLDSLQLSVQNSNILEFEIESENKTTIIAKEKKNAFKSDNLAAALSNMFSRRISNEYNEAFAALDTMPRGSYEKAIESLHEIPHNSGIIGVDSIQKAMSVKSTLFVLNPNELAFAPTAALGGDYIEPSYTSYARTQLSAGLTYRRTNATDFKQDSYLLDLQAKKPIGGDSTLNGFVGAAYEKSTKDSSEIKSNIFSAGLGATRDLGYFGLLGSVSAGFSNNKLNESIANLSNTNTSANYNSYFFHAQGGAYVPFWLGDFGERTNTKLSPIAMLDFTSIHQDSFTQSGGLFAKKFEKSSFNNIRSWLGLNLSHIRDLESGAKFAGNIFGFYWHNFNKPKEQNLSFADASDLHFSSSTDIGRDGLYLGAAAKWAKDRYFIHTSIGGELADKYNQIELMLRFGFEL